MNIAEAITILRRHNDWRSGAEIPQPEPAEIGRAIGRVLIDIEEIALGCDEWHHHDPADTTRGWCGELSTYLRGKSGTTILVHQELARGLEKIAKGKA